MFRIENTLVDDAVVAAPFCCDLRSCAGACCTLEGGRGAPLEDGEVARIAEHYPLIKEYLDPRNVAAIDREGLVEGFPGSYATTCIDRRECVFVYIDGESPGAVSNGHFLKAGAPGASRSRAIFFPCVSAARERRSSATNKSRNAGPAENAENGSGCRFTNSSAMH